MWLQRVSSSLQRLEQVCVFLTPRTPRVFTCYFFTGFVCAENESMPWPFMDVICSPFSFSQQQQKQHFCGALWDSSCQEGKYPHNPWHISRTICRMQIKSGLLQLCTLNVRVCWWPESDFGRKGCLSVLRKWYQINKLFPDPGVSPLCQVTTPTANSSVLSCHLLARLTPEAGERRCGNRRGCALTRRVWESYEHLSILMSQIKWLPSLGLNTGHEG